MGCILHQRQALVGNVEKDNCCAQNTAGAYDTDIQNVCNANQQENQHLAADAAKADRAGKRVVIDGAHNAGQIIDNYKGEKCIQQTITAAKEISKPAAKDCKNKLNGVPEFFHE